MVVKLGHQPGTAPVYRDIGAGQCDRPALSTDNYEERRRLRLRLRSVGGYFTHVEHLSLLLGRPL